jgi:DsbC/DsbD-like thiol-disulfide interchange protein
VISHQIGIGYAEGMIKTFLSCLAVFIVLAVPLTARPVLAQSATQAEVLQAQFLDGWQMDNGHRMAALQLELAPEWKTYWRAPGESGIPPQFDWSGSRNVASVRMHWPNPSVFHLNGMQSIGYHDRLVLPLEVIVQDPSQPVHLQARIDLGICKDICMPANLLLEADFDGAGASDPLIVAALNAQPVGAKAAKVLGISCEVTPIADGLALTARIAMPALSGSETVVFEPADPQIWVASSKAWWEGSVLVATTEMVSGAGGPFALDRSNLRVTVIDKVTSVEVIGCPAP